MTTHVATATPLLHGIALDYLSTRGRQALPRRAVVRAASSTLGEHIAAAYAGAEHAPHNADVRCSYRAFVDETLDQFLHLAARVRVGPWTGQSREQPYADSAELFAEATSGRIAVFLGGELPADHPLAANSGLRVEGVHLTFNHLFRVVHDVFGHALYRLSFGRHGEEGAWHVQSAMFPPEALPALATETRAQTAAFHHGPHRHLPPSKRPYPEQKAALLPPEFSRADPLLGVRAAG